MKRTIFLAGLFVAFTVGLVVLQQQDADAGKTNIELLAATDAEVCDQVLFSNPEAQPRKRCSFNSDCRYGKCKRSKCGGCSFNSDCKGWGKCKRGWCGGCSFNSDCKGFGGCKNGRCKKSPY